jgi:hypothetical protein
MKSWTKSKTIIFNILIILLSIAIYIKNYGLGLIDLDVFTTLLVAVTNLLLRFFTNQPLK